MKTIKERQGRCIGGEMIMRVGLYCFSANTDYVIKVMTGTSKFTKKILYLHLADVTLDIAKAKYYEVLTPLQELWKIDENANND
jgi:hypothetical protein|nr:MAG TPA: hypothetical protein [Caudoviricetes sp.]